MTLEKDEEVLLVYAACDPSGRIMMVTNISRLRPSISANGWEFNNEDTAREAAKWKGVLDNLERNGLIEATDYKRRHFAVTALGYKVAEQVKEKWDIDTNKDPKEYIE